MRITSLVFFEGISLFSLPLFERIPEREVRNLSEEYRNSSISVANHMQMSSSKIK